MLILKFIEDICNFFCFESIQLCFFVCLFFRILLIRLHFLKQFNFYVDLVCGVSAQGTQFFFMCLLFCRACTTDPT